MALFYRLGANQGVCTNNNRMPASYVCLQAHVYELRLVRALVLILCYYVTVVLIFWFVRERDFEATASGRTVGTCTSSRARGSWGFHPSVHRGRARGGTSLSTVLTTVLTSD